MANENRSPQHLASRPAPTNKSSKNPPSILTIEERSPLPPTKQRRVLQSESVGKSIRRERSRGGNLPLGQGTRRANAAAAHAQFPQVGRAVRPPPPPTTPQAFGIYPGYFGPTAADIVLEIRTLRDLVEVLVKEVRELKGVAQAEGRQQQTPQADDAAESAAADRKKAGADEQQKKVEESTATAAKAEEDREEEPEGQPIDHAAQPQRERATSAAAGGIGGNLHAGDTASAAAPAEAEAAAAEQCRCYDLDHNPEYDPETASPYDPATWEPEKYRMPSFIASYNMDVFTTVENLHAEYEKGGDNGEKPPLKWVEKYFGPSNRHGSLPSWRNARVRGTRKHDTQFCRRKKLYDLFDNGSSPADLLDIARRERPGLFSKEENLTNGTVVRWLISYAASIRPGFEKRQEHSKKIIEKRRLNKALKRQREEESG